MSTNRLRDLERHGVATLATINKLAPVLGVTFDELVVRSEALDGARATMNAADVEFASVIREAERTVLDRWTEKDGAADSAIRRLRTIVLGKSSVTVTVRGRQVEVGSTPRARLTAGEALMRLRRLTNESRWP